MTVLLSLVVSRLTTLAKRVVTLPGFPDDFRTITGAPPYGLPDFLGKSHSWHGLNDPKASLTPSLEPP